MRNSLGSIFITFLEHNSIKRICERFEKIFCVVVVMKAFGHNIVIQSRYVKRCSIAFHNIHASKRICNYDLLKKIIFIVLESTFN